MVAVDAVAILDTGSGLSTMSEGIARKLQEAYPGVQIVGGMQQGGKVKLAYGRVRDVTSKTCPVRIAVQCCSTEAPQSFSAIIPTGYLHIHV